MKEAIENLLKNNPSKNGQTKKSGGASLGSVLIVDDEADIVGVLQSFLEERGYHVTGTYSPIAAAEFLRTRPFDVLITDLVMPGMRGIDLLKIGLRKDPDLIGIIMTGYGSIESALEAMRAGAFDYILKPFRFEMLVPILSRAMRVRKLARSERKYRALAEELTFMVNSCREIMVKQKSNDLVMLELREEIERLKGELAIYKTMEKQCMFYEA